MPPQLVNLVANEHRMETISRSLASAYRPRVLGERPAFRGGANPIWKKGGGWRIGADRLKRIIGREENLGFELLTDVRELGCTRHKKAEKLLGSYRAKVAVTILSKNMFRCSYCGERTMMQVRNRLPFSIDVKSS